MNITVNSFSPIAILTLLNLKGIGPKSVIKLCSQFSSLAQMKEVSSEAIANYIPKPAIETWFDPDNWRRANTKAERQTEIADKLSVRIITFTQKEYPALLNLIPNFPPVVFIKGQIPQTAKRAACVGTREPTMFGAEVAKRLVRLLVEDGWSIVSGLALGVDTISHTEALDAHGHTIAVLANGLDTVYPRQNANLAERILDKGGALLSEQPFGSPANAAFLVSRDRLQSGLSAATFVMQTDIKGGTMHTVRFTLLQGRSVYVPSPPDQYKHESKNQGIIMLGSKVGSELASVLSAEGAYKEILVKKFSSRPVARTIKGSTEYPALIQEVNALASSYRNQNKSAKSEQPNLF